MSLLQPKRTKFRKQRTKGHCRGNASSGLNVSFGQYGLKTTEQGLITSRQIEAARRAITRYVKRGAKIWIRIFPDKPITRKGLGMRQGSGKGNVEFWAARVRPGKVLYEIEGVSREIAEAALKRAAGKLALNCIFVERKVI